MNSTIPRRMDAAYTVERLRADRVDQAYPLMQAIDPRLDLDGWRSWCRRMRVEGVAAGEGTIVFVVVSASGYFHGICLVDREPQGADGFAVAVSKLLIDNVIDPAGVAAALLRALASYAGDARCDRLRLSAMGTDEAAMVALARERAASFPASLPIEIV